MTLYDQPADPLATVKEMAARIGRVHAATGVLVSGEALTFDVPALAGWEVRRAGDDVALDDQSRFGRHALALPPAGWLTGWVAHPDTVEGLSRPGRDQVWAPPGMGPLSSHPVWESAAAPPGVLVPVYVRPASAGTS